MGYNANLTRVQPIPSRSGAAASAIAYPLIPQPNERVTVPYLRLGAGAGGGNLAVLQTEYFFKFNLLLDGTILTIPGIPADLSGRFVVIRYPGGETKFVTITGQTGDALTLSASIVATESATLYILGTEESETTSTFALTASTETILQADCPGVVVGKHLGWPVVLYLENTDGNQKIEGGTAAFIGV